MAQLGMPLNGIEYNAEDASIWFYGRTNGVFGGEYVLKTTATTGMNVSVSPGGAWMTPSQFRSIAYANTAPVTLTCQMADGILHRIDRVVIRWNITQIGTHPFILIKQGTLSSNPVPPAVERTASVWELGIADIRINAGTIALTQSMVTDQRLNEAICGLVRDGIERIPTAALEAQFYDWFETIQDVLDENVVTNLYNLITGLQNSKFDKPKNLSVVTVDKTYGLKVYSDRTTSFDEIFMPIIKNQNILIGTNAPNLTTGNNNTSLGYNALSAITTGYENTAIGDTSLYSNTIGRMNTAIGNGASHYNTTGIINTAIGHLALRDNIIGTSNTAIGAFALYRNISGGNNLGCGNAAGSMLANGYTNQTEMNNSVYIGANSKGSANDNQTNQIVIGYNAIGYGSNSAHIGNTEVTSISYGAGTGTAFTTRSDPRIKEDIQDADISMCYDDIKSLKLHRFKYKDFVGNTGDKHLTGFLSNEFAEILPKAVRKVDSSFDMVDENGEKVYEMQIVDGIETQIPKQIVIKNCESIDTSQIVPALMGAVQMLMEKVEYLERKI